MIEITEGLAALQRACHSDARERGWWSDLETGEPKERNTGELLMLIVSEVAEAMEGARKDLQDAHLPHRKSIEVELADAIIRIADLAESLKLDLGAAVVEKMEFNRNREDHAISARKQSAGKKW